MKKIYFLLCNLITAISFAQPTITQSDLPTPGHVWVSGIDTAYSAAIPAGGANQNWDFSSLIVNQQDSINYVAAATSPYAGSFPSSNLASYPISGGDWNYYTTNSSGWYLDGFYTGGTILVLNPHLLYASAPLSYGDTGSNVARGQVDTVVFGTPFRIIQYLNASYEADGWGTLKTPTSTFSSVLRLKETILTSDSILYDLAHSGNYTLYSASQSQTTSFHWLRHGYTVLDVLSIDGDSLGVMSTRSNYYIGDYVLSTNDLSPVKSSVRAYPNPADDLLHFLIDGNLNNASLRIYDALGRNVYESDVKGLSEFSLPADKLQNGIYYYSLTTDKETFSAKFTVAH